MAKDAQSMLRDVVLNALESSGKSSNGAAQSASRGHLSGLGGLAAGAGAAALVPLAVKNLGKLTNVLGIEGANGLVKTPGKALEGAMSNVGDRVGAGIGDKVSEKVDQAGGPGGILKDTVKSALPFSGGGGGAKNETEGAGKGRRMPVQQSVDIGAPIETVYNQWTQFEDWPSFMHRLTRVTQEDDCTVSFAAKIWGITREFTAEIETQRPDERIKWRVSQGMSHTGVVTFHELGPQLTRVLLGLDVEPGGLLEKAARGMRHIKRAARGDLHRFKAIIEMSGRETGAWRGVIEDNELVEEHDPSYDEQREYADRKAQLANDSDEQSGSEDDRDDDQAPKRQRSGRQKQATATRRRTPAKSSSRPSGNGRSSSSKPTSRGKSTRSGSPRRSTEGKTSGRRSRARGATS